MQIIKYFIILSLSITIAFSQDQFERILITKTKNESNLSKIKKNLNKIGIKKMYVQNLQNMYYIYSKKFTDSQYTQQTLAKIKTKFPKAKIVYIPSHKKSYYNVQKNNKNLFINLALGYAKINNSKNSSINKISTSAMSYILEGGYAFNNNISIFLGYINSSTDDISMFNIYSGVSYKYYITTDFSIASGLILGYSSLEMNNYSSSTASENLLYGFDLAISYDLVDSFYIFTKYQGFLTNHVININSSSKVEFDYINNYSIGIGYKF